MYGWENDSYGEYDLKVGIQYAKDLIQFEGLKKEPFHDYDLRKFIKWCEIKLTHQVLLKKYPERSVGES